MFVRMRRNLPNLSAPRLLWSLNESGVLRIPAEFRSDLSRPILGCRKSSPAGVKRTHSGAGKASIHTANDASQCSPA
jgi:hypothetical protein